ncbi:hypothetical protein [Nostoc sp. ChiQUE01b]|uniref:hypothetical protein n=1 Tax=Nostoc sp. ChiQUE01b TaxID=3075376 RepID=UPI002AD386AA|nr:hypothetical protein [Nostoc sp. ChiQUE01b]MDZ8259636.1 hypothetical protein [Nostoc sp. ChiQUE01b]
MHYCTKIKILALDHVESIILEEITVAEAEKIIGGNLAKTELEPAINECKVSSVGDCLCEGENNKYWLIHFSPIDPHHTENRDPLKNQSYLYNSSITSLNFSSTESVILQSKS